ncbi:MAG: undecaprenyl-diphosphate phosphatase [Burkholderiales bacterium]
MDPILYLKALILGIVEGLTEFLPVSSTGHLIVAADLLGFNGESAETFEVAIQLGAILAVCFEFRARIKRVTTGLLVDPAAQRFAANLLIAFLPSALLGLLFYNAIVNSLFNPFSVALALIGGGMVILWAERCVHVMRVDSVDNMTFADAFKVGLAQCAALIPGVSRSGATIIGAMMFGLSRSAATEFSFFLAVPTMFAATFYSIFRTWHFLNFDDLGHFSIGFAAAFVSALIAVRALLRYVAHHDFNVFGWYRIAFGSVVLGYYWS